jgi:hypothetical protein
MAESKRPSKLISGSYVLINGGKYCGHYATVTGFTPTGQCRILIDTKRQALPGAMPTMNSKTRCARRHVSVALIGIGIERTDDPDPPEPPPASSVLEPNVSIECMLELELDLIAQLVALRLKSSVANDNESTLMRFNASVRRYLKEGTNVLKL